jgi:hypothetical protein
MKEPELGDSDKAKRRMERVKGAIALARVNRCPKGFKESNGMERLREGTEVVGGSYLVLVRIVTLSRAVNATYLTHMTNTSYPLTGIFFSCSKTSANLSSPRPLLVVHSGNTTTGRSELRLISSSEAGGVSDGKKGGTDPVARNIVSIETDRNPRIRERIVAILAAGEEIAAEPVPVRRPGVLVIGVEDLESGSGSWTGSQIGSTNIGSNLTRVMSALYELERVGIPER